MANNASNPSTSKAFLLVAVVLGILATMLAFIFIRNSSTGAGAPTIDIPVARHDISAMSPFDPERDIELQPFPAKFKALQQRSVDWASRDLMKGKKVNRAIFAGQPVLNSDFAEVGKFEFKSPYVAMEIPAVSAQAVPGDYVKFVAVMGMRAAVDDATKPAGQAVILGKDPGYLVLAVGGITNLTRQMVTTSGTTMEFRKITIKVTEDQARELAPYVAMQGSLSVLVMPPGASEAATTTSK